MTKIKNMLLQITSKTYHFIAKPKVAPPYIVWAEDSRNDFVADGKHIEKVWQGTVDLFTKTEGDSKIEQIEQGFDSLGVAWELNSVQYETDTGLIHYEWVWQDG